MHSNTLSLVLAALSGFRVLEALLILLLPLLASLLSRTAPKHVSWPQYSLSDPYNIVFDVNKTDLAYTALDNVHKKEIAFLLDDVFANDS
ncbi:hypothetical protein H9Q74_013422 [Fusarium xylarioides]|nr:hypothetical protein H9Q71_012350 [Fusarium xylarioides]KAG5811804.1 hypothetical protein H9Q74_013422 [Fusarium xylarioides]